MALKYGFFNSSNGDRKYDAEDISSIFDGVIGDGIFATIGKIFAVTPGEGLQVLVDTGKAWFNHTWTVNNEIVPLNLEEPDITLDRYDAVVLEINHSESVRANSLKVVKGEAGSEPIKPSLIRDDLVNQYPLAYVLVKHGASSLTSAEIEITVGKGECPFVRGPIETVPIDELFSKWESEFDSWFENVQSQLEGDIAANLQRQIDERVKISDKASEEEALLGKSDEKWLTPHTGRALSIWNGFEVGDTKKTANPNPNENWLLCNGALVEREQYPDLSELFPSDITVDTWASGKQMGSSSYATSISTGIDLLYEAGYFVYLGTKYNSTNGTTVIFISYTTDISSGNWTSVDVWENNVNITAERLCYVNGYFVICGAYEAKGSDTAYGRIAYSKTPAGPWGIKDLWSASGNSTDTYVNVSGITYGNGRYVATGSSGTTVQVGYASSIDGSWSTKTITSDYTGHTGSGGNDVIYNEGLFIILATRIRFTEYGRLFLYYASSPTGTFTEKELIASSQGTFGKSLYYINDKYVVSGCYSNSSSKKRAMVLYSDSLLNSFDFMLFGSSQTRNQICYRFGYIAGRYWASCILVGDTSDEQTCSLCINDGSSINGGYKKVDLYSTFKDTRIGMLIESEGFWAVAASSSTSSSSSYTYARLAAIDTSKFKLPSIATENGLRTFIKAKG